MHECCQAATSFCAVDSVLLMQPLSVLQSLHAVPGLCGSASDVRCNCAGPLKPTLLSYYALTSDHVQRLQGVRANGKFSSTAATSDTPMSKPEDLKSIVADARVSSQAPMSQCSHSQELFYL